MKDEDYNTMMDVCAGLAGQVPYVGGAISMCFSFLKKSEAKVSWQQIQDYVADQLLKAQLEEIKNTIEKVYMELEQFQEDVETTPGETLWVSILLIQDKIKEISEDLLSHQGFPDKLSSDGIWFRCPWESLDAAQQLILLEFTVVNEMLAVAENRRDNELGYGQEKFEGDRDSTLRYLNTHVNAYRRAMDVCELPGHSQKDRMSRIKVSKDYQKNQGQEYGVKQYFAVKWSDSLNSDKKGDWSENNDISTFSESNPNAARHRREHRNLYLDWMNQADGETGVEIKQKIFDPFNSLIKKEGIENSAPIPFRKPFAKTKNFNVIINQCSESLIPETSVAYYSYSDGWDSLDFFEIGGKTYLFMLKSSNGKIHVHRVNVDGTIGDTVDNRSWSDGYTTARFFRCQDGHLCLFLLKSGNGTVNIHRMNTDGTIGDLVWKDSWTSGWTMAAFYTVGPVTGNAPQDLFILKKSSGLWHHHKMNSNGSLIKSELAKGGFNTPGTEVGHAETYVDANGTESVFLSCKEGTIAKYCLVSGPAHYSNIRSGATLSDCFSPYFYWMWPNDGRWCVASVQNDGTLEIKSDGTNEVSLKGYNTVKFYRPAGSDKVFQLAVQKAGSYTNIGA